MRKGETISEEVRKQAVVGEPGRCTDLKAVLPVGKWRFKTEGCSDPLMGLFYLEDFFWKLFRII